MIETLASAVPLTTTELGIIGLVVSGLLSLVWYVVASSNSREDKRSNKFVDTVLKLDERHRQERSEWTKEANARSHETTSVLKELEKAIENAVNK